MTLAKDSILHEINGRIDSFRDKSGRFPQAIYLGKNKLKQLRHELERTQLHTVADTETPTKGIIIRDIPVIEYHGNPYHCQVG